MGKNDYVQTNIILLCDKGTMPTPLIATPKMQNHHGITGATIRDNLPLLNILPFGICTTTHYPCVPVMPTWEDYPKSPYYIEGFQPLILSSYARCKLGGTIKIYTSYQEVLVETKDLSKSWKDQLLAAIDRGIGNALLSPVGPILELSGKGDVVQSVGEFGRGVITGFGKGLISTVEGLYNMVAHPLDTLGGLAQLAGVAIVGYSTPSIATTPEQKLQMFDSLFHTNLSAVDSGIKQSLSESWDTLLHGTNVERGEIVGQAIEFIAEFAVGKGAGAAMKSAKAGEMGKMAKLANLADKATDILKATSGKLQKWTLEKLPKSITGIFGKKKVASYQHGHSDGGPGTWEHRTTPDKNGSAAYQEKVTGAPKDTEYVVKTDKMKRGEKKFDGYDPETKTLQDAKEWENWPPKGQKWAEEKIAKDAKLDAAIAKEAGAKLEWHVPTQEKATQLEKIFDKYEVSGIEIKVTTIK